MTYRGAILDVDGTVVRGDEPIPGAREGLETLAAAGVRRLFVSNNPTKPPAAYERRFARGGFDVSADEVLTSGSITTRYLAREHPSDRIAVVGERGLTDQFRAAGLDVVDVETAADVKTAADVETAVGADADEEREADGSEAVVGVGEAGGEADVLVVSLDREFDYDDLCAAYWTLADGAVTFLGTDPDVIIPAAERDVPGSGAILNAVAGVAGRDPERVLGKPSAVARRMALDALGVPPEECLVVGDRLDTDVALGARAGMTTALVRTGVTDEAALAAADVRPDYVLDSLGDVGTVLAADG
ncbi:MAG: HAD-IIA family hydrolase [Salinigranum sp.]